MVVGVVTLRVVINIGSYSGLSDLAPRPLGLTLFHLLCVLLLEEHLTLVEVQD